MAGVVPEEGVAVIIVAEFDLLNRRWRGWFVLGLPVFVRLMGRLDPQRKGQRRWL